MWEYILYKCFNILNLFIGNYEIHRNWHVCSILLTISQLFTGSSILLSVYQILLDSLVILLDHDLIIVTLFLLANPLHTWLTRNLACPLTPAKNTLAWVEISFQWHHTCSLYSATITISLHLFHGMYRPRLPQKDKINVISSAALNIFMYFTSNCF